MSALIRVRGGLKERLERIWHALERHADDELVDLLDDFCTWWLERRQPTHLRLRIQPKGDQMGITVDTTTGKATADFEDDHDDVVAAPAGLDAFVWSSDNTAVLTVANDATDPLSADITPVAVGTANIALAAPTAGGAPVLNAAGAAIAAPSPVNVAVGPGPAASLVLTVTE